MTVKRRSLFLIGLVTMVCIFSLVAGAGLGYYRAIKFFRSAILYNARAETLALLIKDNQKRRDEMAQCYRNPEKAAREIDGYAWAPPTVVSPFVGAASRPGKHGTATINALQFRSSKELASPKQEGSFRIFLTGGSTAFSVGAPGEDGTIAAYLEEILDSQAPGAGMPEYEFEVFTMASPAWCSTHERIMIENRLVELDPDLVISFSGNNDIHWSIGGYNTMWMRTYADQFYFSLLNMVYGISRLREYIMPDLAAREGKAIPSGTVTDRLERNVRLASHALSLRGIPYIFFLQPTISLTGKKLNGYEAQYLKPEKKGYFTECYRAFRTRLSAIDDANLTFIDMSGIFDNMQDDEQIFLDSYHFGDKGNRIIAGHMSEHIIRLIGSSKSSDTIPGTAANPE